MVRDWMACRISLKTKGRNLAGAKPLEFNLWILDLLNYQEGDQIDDLFIGSNSLAEALETYFRNKQVG